MRLLLINSGLGRGGKERQISELIKGSRDKITINLIVLDNDLAYDIRNTGIQILAVDRNQRHSLTSHRRIYRFIRGFRPDIIHYWDHLSFIFALEYRMFHKCVLIDGSIRYAGDIRFPLSQRMLKRASFYLSNSIVANSKAGLKLEGQQDSIKSRVIYNGIDSTRFLVPQELPPGISGLIESSIKIVMCAGFRPAKDHITLIKAASIICDTYTNVQFLLIGDGPGKKGIMDMLPSRYAEKVLFLGVRDDVEQILSICDIGILLNNIIGHAEGCSNAIMEYMAAGLPVVATNAGGNSEIIVEGVTGFLVEGFDLDQVVEKLTILINDKSIRDSFGRAAKEIIKNKYSLEVMADHYLELYKTLCDARH
jgi:glycosyltransferase involved in cell wall biosynthesis